MRLFTLLLLLLATHSYAGEIQSTTLTYKYDVDATAVEYCSAFGADGGYWGGPKAGGGVVTSVGSSVTWTSATDAFANGLAAGDYVTATRGNTTFLRVVVSVDSDSQITVDEAANVTAGFRWGWWDVTCGTGAEVGWVDVGGWDSLLMTYDLSQLSVTGGIDLRPECRADGPGAPVIVIATDGEEDAITTTGTGYYSVVLFEAGFTQCRFGAYIDSEDDGTDTGTDREELTVVFTRFKQ